MQPIDPHTLFSIFEKGDEEIYKEHGLEETLDNPFVLMGMVIRGIDNFILMDMMYMKKYPKEYKNVRELTRYKYFNKLYGYLLRIDHTDFNDVYTVGDSFEYKEVFNGLDYLRRYYEYLEEYEKCGVIKSYQDLLHKKPTGKVGYMI